MAITLTQTASGSTATTSTSLAASTISVATGSMIVVAVDTPGADVATSVTDSTGVNTYTALTDHLSQSSQRSLRFFYCANVTGNAAFIVTGHYPSAATAGIFVWNVAGMGAATADVDTSGITTTAGTVTSSPFTTAQANEFIAAIAFHAGTASTWSFQTGYSHDSSFYSVNMGAQSDIFSSVQTSATSAMTWGGSSGNAGIAVASFSQGPTAATPTFSPAAGTYTGTQTVTITSSTVGGTVFYTTDGTTPTHSSSSISNGGTISVATSCTVNAIESATGFLDSAVGSAAYTINASGGGGIGTVLTGAAIGVKVVNSAGYDTPITSPTVTTHLGLPIPVVFCDPNGNEYAITGATKGNFVKAPLPVVLCDPNGRPIVPPIVLTSNGNSVSITATLTGKKLGQPTPVMLTDPNGFLYTLSGFSFGTNAQRPIPVCLCDIHGNVVTMTIAT